MQIQGHTQQNWLLQTAMDAKTVQKEISIPRHIIESDSVKPGYGFDTIT